MPSALKVRNDLLLAALRTHHLALEKLRTYVILTFSPPNAANEEHLRKGLYSALQGLKTATKGFFLSFVARLPRSRSQALPRSYPR